MYVHGCEKEWKRNRDNQRDSVYGFQISLNIIQKPRIWVSIRRYVPLCCDVTAFVFFTI